MDDQVAALRQLGIAAGALHSELPPEEARAVGRALDDGTLDLLYVSPERLLSPGTLERLQRRTLALIAIDEAHCVSQWGHEFRREYRDLAQLGSIFPAVPRIALTATADPRTREDILAALALPRARVFAASFHRPNLHLAASPKTTELGQLLEVLARHRNAAGIVYCGSRAKTERMTASLLSRGVTAIAFHAGLPPAEKREALARFRSGEAVVMVATIAFGMGIDRPDVRFVVHLDMPDSPESYYQQIGRAGRDGEPAETLLLYGGEDIARARHWLGQSNAPETQREAMRQRLEAMIALTETAACRTRTLLACFGEELGQGCGHCDNCDTPARTFDGTVEAQKVLSAVWRTGQRFGARHAVDVLIGKTSAAIARFEHDKLPTFGVGADRPEPFWRSVIRQLIARGVLSIENDPEEGRFTRLVIDTDKARPILRGEEQVMLREELIRPKPSRSARVLKQADLDGTESALFEALRVWRAEEAKRQNVPPYFIFQTIVLRDIAEEKPDTVEALAEIRGVGASKLARYGASVLALVRRAK
jgi:ATP-dependent DNA helicase RecQ